MTLLGPDRQVVLLRHAKSAWPRHGVPDHERPLAGKGRRNAQATGAWFATEGLRPQVVLCSDAVRARHTWEIISASIKGSRPKIRVRPDLYGADPQDVLDLLHPSPTRCPWWSWSDISRR